MTQCVPAQMALLSPQEFLEGDVYGLRTYWLCVSHTNKQKTQYLSVSLYEMIVTISLKKAIISNLKLISTNQSHGLFYFIFLQ